MQIIYRNGKLKNAKLKKKSLKIVFTLSFKNKLNNNGNLYWLGKRNDFELVMNNIYY